MTATAVVVEVVEAKDALVMPRLGMLG